MEAFYKGVQVFSEKLSEFVREIAALVLVFIPLDLWKNELTWSRALFVFATSAMLFVSGIGLEFVAIVVHRARVRYEEELQGI